MRKILNLIGFHSRANLTMYLIIGLIVPVLMMLLPVLIGSSQEPETPPFGIVNFDDGELATAILEDYDQSDEIQKLDSTEEADKLLLDEDIQMYYVFPSNFSEVLAAGNTPKIEVVTTDAETWEGVAPVLTTHLRESIQSYRTKAIFNEYNLDDPILSHEWEIPVEYEGKISPDLSFAGVMIAYTLLFGSTVLANSLVKLKKKRILYRSLATPTKPGSFLGGTLLAASLFQIIGALVAICVVSVFFEFALGDILKLVVTSTALILLSASLQLFILRIFKDEGVSMLASSAIILVMFFLIQFYEFKDFLKGVPDFLFKLVYLSPFYWAREAMVGNFLLAIAVILLTALSFFLIGSTKTHKFVHA